jgi:DNA-binding transcriptional MerR regulator
MSVGEFSRVTHLSVKTLRHYHQVGLFEPAMVDTHNGYRYYAVQQIPTAQVIRRLRDLDMPIADVKAVLTAETSGERNALITTHLDRLESELVRTRVATESLRRLLAAPDRQVPIEHRTVAPTAAVGIQEVIDREDVLAWWQGVLGELHAIVRAQQLIQTGPSGGLYAAELYQHDRGQATVFIPVNGVVREIGRVTAFVVPQAELAVVTHRGSLADIDLTYGELGSYATSHEISVDGPLREYYLRDSYDTADESTWETEVGWPIFRADP